MMSIAAMGVGEASADYCIGSTREDYYQNGGDPLGHWRGRGCASLGLTDAVHSPDFGAVLLGQHPASGQALTGIGSGSINHRAGWDCTFSAPKSVSTLWALSDASTRVKIEGCHEKAIAAALDYLDHYAAFTRRGHGGSEQEPVAGLVCATFKHFTSRAGDPQLHTHCIVMNLAPREDGSFGSIESKHLYDHKMAAGAVYRMALGTALTQEGYALRSADHGFEIAGIDPALCHRFSKRREQIGQALEEHGGRSAAASQIATLATREAKQESQLSERLEYWRHEAQAWLNELPQPGRGVRPPVAADQQAVLSALTQSQSTFSHRDLIREMAKQGVGHLDYAGLLSSVGSILRSDAVIPIAAHHAGESRYTTAEMLNIETKCLETAAALADQHTCTIPEHAVKACTTAAERSTGITLSVEQHQAVSHIATKTGRIALVEGLAGTGKTQMLHVARSVYESAGYRLHGCSLSGKAAQNLQEGSGIQSQTLHRLLDRLNKKQHVLGVQDVVVLDEAAMVGSRQMHLLLEHVARSGSKIVMIGDTKQLQPIDAGQMFGTLVRELGKSDLQDIRRQHETWARDAVRDVLSGRSGDALAAFDQRGLLSRCESLNAGVELLTQHWLSDHSPTDQKLVLAGTRLEAFRINQSIRLALQQVGHISNDEVEFSTSQGGTRRLAAGDRVVFLRNDLGLGVKNGTLGVVIASHSSKTGPKITVQVDRGRSIEVHLNQYSHVEHGFALTVHKAQGTTVDGNVYVMASEAMTDREWSYVALSRARGTTRIYTTQQDHLRLEKAMQRSRRKDTSLDHFQEQEREI